ncbi:MAG: hypothetical protein WHT08_14945 [Bryobacteraceae bacterium]
MRLAAFLILALSVLSAAPPPPRTLEEVRREGDPLRRFDQAIRFAETRMKEAWKLVREEGSRAQFEAAVEEVVECSQLALESLRATGRRPGKLTRQYKRGELRTRSFEKELRELALAVGFDERERVESARRRIAAIHEEFLHAVMSGR